MNAAERIAELVATRAETLLYCRSMDNPACNPKEAQERYMRWLEAEVRKILDTLNLEVSK